MPVCGLLVISLYTEPTFDTWHHRICLYKNMGFTQILILMQVRRLWNLPMSTHCNPVCTKLFHVSNETLYLFSTIREGSYTSVVGWPWLGHGVFTEKRQKKVLQVNHGWLWLVSQPWLPMVDHGLAKLFFKPYSAMVDHGLAKLF